MKEESILLIKNEVNRDSFGKLCTQSIRIRTSGHMDTFPRILCKQKINTILNSYLNSIRCVSFHLQKCTVSMSMGIHLQISPSRDTVNVRMFGANILQNKLSVSDSEIFSLPHHHFRRIKNDNCFQLFFGLNTITIQTARFRFPFGCEYSEPMSSKSSWTLSPQLLPLVGLFFQSFNSQA